MGAAQIVNVEIIFLYRRSILRKWDEFSFIWQKLFTNFVRYLQKKYWATVTKSHSGTKMRPSVNPEPMILQSWEII